MNTQKDASNNCVTIESHETIIKQKDDIIKSEQEMIGRLLKASDKPENNIEYVKKKRLRKQISLSVNKSFDIGKDTLKAVIVSLVLESQSMAKLTIMRIH